MAIKRNVPIDDDGNVLPPPPPDSDVGQAIYLLEYGRLRGFRLGPTIQIGSVILQVQDLRLDSKKATETPDRGIWEEHGYDENV